MTGPLPAPLSSAVLAVHKQALSVDAALVDLSRAQQTGNPDRVGNALFDLQSATDELTRFIGKALDATADVTLPALLAVIPAAEPFPSIAQGA